jgi:rhamnogalacturonyl hydrolase YesR
MKALTLLFVLLSTTTALPNFHTTTHLDKTPFSLQMAQSIISRNQGILTSQDDSSALLQAGFTQKVFSQLLSTYPNASAYLNASAYPNASLLAPSINAYIIRSLDSVIPVISKVTRDIRYPLDRLSTGNAMIRRWEETGEEKYRKTVEALKGSVELQPRNEEGGLWYYTYPHWSYLDGMYSFSPFVATYYSATNTNSTASSNASLVTMLDDVVLQLELLWQHCYYAGDENGMARGLLVHGYDASRTAIWANNRTGASPHVWGRSLGWYCMALLDTLELLPSTANNTARGYMTSRFQELMAAVVKARDAETGAWAQVLDQPGRQGNYVESSGSGMFVYALLKGVRLGYLSPSQAQAHQHLPSSTNTTASYDQMGYVDLAIRAYEYLAHTFVVQEAEGILGGHGGGV